MYTNQGQKYKIRYAFTIRTAKVNIQSFFFGFHIFGLNLTENAKKKKILIEKVDKYKFFPYPRTTELMRNLIMNGYRSIEKLSKLCQFLTPLLAPIVHTGCKI